MSSLSHPIRFVRAKSHYGKVFVHQTRLLLCICKLSNRVLPGCLCSVWVHTCRWLRRCVFYQISAQTCIFKGELNARSDLMALNPQGRKTFLKKTSKGKKFTRDRRKQSRAWCKMFKFVPTHTHTHAHTHTSFTKDNSLPLISFVCRQIRCAKCDSALLECYRFRREHVL